MYKRQDWSRLERYRPVARKMASQAEIYLSRGCPFDCAFCMERAKRDVSWRAFEPERAVEEIHRLDAFLDLSRWTLFVADALFGMKSAWRKAFLEGLARRPCRARKVWLLIRVDLVDREDIELMARANVSPGFGLESGDPEHLKRIRKAGKLDGYLEHGCNWWDWAAGALIATEAGAVVHVADVHPRPLAHGLEAAQDGYLAGVVVGRALRAGNAGFVGHSGGLVGSERPAPRHREHRRRATH